MTNVRIAVKTLIQDTVMKYGLLFYMEVSIIITEI